jgi:hypothetical protein
MNLFRLFSRTRATARRPRLTIEALEGRDLMSATPLATPLTPPSDLKNALVRRVADAEFRQDNGHLTRTDVINLIDVVDGYEVAVFAKDGDVSFQASTDPGSGILKGKELNDLRTLAKDYKEWGMTDYEANLLGKLVNYNVANEGVNERANLTPPIILPSGKLKGGDADSIMNTLMGKWFLGTDLPSLQNVTNGLPSSLGTISYQEAKGRLFGKGGPKASDVAQGWVGDCYFMSALGETAQRDPEAIRDMFINNHDETCTVCFYNNGKPDYVTVNLELPVDASGNFLFAGWYADGVSTSFTSKKNVLWVALAEKAYVQLAQEGWSRNTLTGSGIAGETPSDGNQNCYDALNYGYSGTAIQQITGVKKAVGGETLLTNGKPTAGARKELIGAWQDGDLVVFGSLSQEPGNVPTDCAKTPLIVSNHVYGLTGYDPKTQLFTLTNPYADGDNYATGDGTRTAELTWKELTEYLHDFAYVAL